MNHFNIEKQKNIINESHNYFNTISKLNGKNK
jgi:hypothetical protein